MPGRVLELDVDVVEVARKLVFVFRRRGSHSLRRMVRCAVQVVPRLVEFVLRVLAAPDDEQESCKYPHTESVTLTVREDEIRREISQKVACAIAGKDYLRDEVVGAAS
jgi:hypothetical protein